ncbi:hypothetical protein QWY84_11100 [Aquisalimonas lutea]|uniref:hypothetical protein n=1 Tax=Aquisalimonas lutea TaxID=1327750 RepID=UPI0025B3EFBA|nr:hypothetical protein [Aquisalimonas lutea]MDN3518158.1 hypothetical protein [Aquisalimonas lutea]
MDTGTVKTATKFTAQALYLTAGAYMAYSVFWYFHVWELPLWQWIAALIVAPFTVVVMPIYVGFTEGDWSLVAVWVGGLAVVGLSALLGES